MRVIFRLFLIIFLLIVSQVGAEDLNHEHLHAVEIADARMLQFDQGIYRFDEGVSDVFKSYVTEEQWSTPMKEFRKDFGTLQSRKILSYEYKTSISGMPEGDYIYVQFQSQYENKKDALEFIVMFLENSEWRLMGYYMR